MNCHECNEQLVAYAEGLLHGPAADAIAAHIATCETCRTAADEQARLESRLIAAGREFRAAELEKNVMDRIFREQAHALRGKTAHALRGKTAPRLLTQALTTAAAILVIAFLWYVGPLPDKGSGVGGEEEVGIVLKEARGPRDTFGPKVDDWLLAKSTDSPSYSHAAPSGTTLQQNSTGTPNSRSGGIFYNDNQRDIDTRALRENLILPNDRGVAMNGEAIKHIKMMDSLGYSMGTAKGHTIDLQTESTVLSTFGVSGGADPTAGVQLKLGDAAHGLRNDEYGFSVGGAKDVDSFRQNVEAGFLPLPTDLSVEGLYYDYYFDTGDTYRSDDLFYPSYSKASTCDPFTGKPEYYLTVGLNSGMKSLVRKKLNLVIVLDVSGSMESTIAAYHYDGNGTPPAGSEGAPKQKIRAAAESLLGLVDHLNEEDRFGMVLFSDKGKLAKPLRLVGETDMASVRSHIEALGAGGSTNLSDGLRIAFDQYGGDFANGGDFARDAGEYENRIVVLTDAMPNKGKIDDATLLATMRQQAAKRIYTTFIGIGIDFNSTLVHGITTTRGANYFSVQSSNDFKRRLDEEFDLMVTPLVFDLALNLESSGYRIDKVFGSPGVDRASGSIMKIDTLFPSRRVEEETRGGVVLLKLTRKHDYDPSDDEICLAVTFEDRYGKEYRSTRSIRFGEIEPEHFDNAGVRKAVLLARYANMVQSWLLDARAVGGPTDGTYALHDDFRLTRERGIMERPAASDGLGRWERKSRPLVVNDHYGELFVDFRTYFKSEMGAIDDASLYREVMILDKLAP